MGRMGLLQAKRGVPFRPVDQGLRQEQERNSENGGERLQGAKGSGFPPPTPDKLKFLGGVLKAAGYKSAGNYLGEYKLTAVESGASMVRSIRKDAEQAIGNKGHRAKDAGSRSGHVQDRRELRTQGSKHQTQKRSPRSGVV